MGKMLFNPSDAHRWGSPRGCRASVVLSQGAPKRPRNTKALEGTEAHAIGADVLRGFERAIPPRPKPGEVADGIVITDEMVQAVEMYTQVVHHQMRTTGVFGGPNIGIETFVLCPDIHPACGGYPDSWVFDQKNRVLHINEYKHGRNIVEAENNWQGITLASGLRTIIGGEFDVVITVVQPRVYHRDGPIRAWPTSTLELAPMWEQLRVAAMDALLPNPVCRAGRHCAHCAVATTCSANTAMVFDGMEYTDQAVSDTRTAESLAVELSLLDYYAKAIKTRKTAIKEEVEHLLTEGGTVPGFDMADDYGHLAWVGDRDEIATLGDGMGIELRKPVQLVTPTQAMNELKLDKNIVSALSKRPYKGKKLTSVSQDDLQKVFG